MADDNKIIAEVVVIGVDEFKAELKGGQAAVDQFTKEVKEGTADAKKGFEQLTDTTQSWRAQLKGMTSELVAANLQLAEMKDAGQQGTKEFTNLEKKIEDLRKKAGNLKDAMADANDQIKATGSDTAGLDKAIRAVGSATAAFQVFEGATVLAGKGNEDLQKALVKLNAVMAITQGLQQIQNELVRDDSVFKGLATKATAAYNIVVGQSTGALKAFRLALAATGIGLAIVGIVALVENWDKLKTAIGLSTYNLDEFNKKIEEGNEYIDGRSKAQQRDLLEMEKIGKSEAEIAAKRLEFAKENETLSLERLNQLREEEIASRGNKDANKKILEDITKQKNDYYNATINTTKAEIALDKALAAEKKAQAEEIKNAELKKQEEYEKSRDVLARYQEQLDKLKKEIIFLTNEEVRAGNNPVLNKKILTLQDEYIKLEKQIKSVQDVTDKLLTRPSEAEPIELKIKIGDKKSIDDFNKSVAQQLEQMKPIVLEPETREQELEKVFEKAQQYYTQIQQVVGQTLNLISNATQIRAENEIAALDRKRQRGLISEKQYEKEVAKIKNDAAQKQRRAEVINAFAMIPMAVLSAFTNTQGGIVAKGIAAGIAGAFALAQASLVAAAPLPKFRDGGSVAKRLGLIKGKSHEQGGVPIEVEGNEYVMNKRAVSKYGVDFMDSINNLKLSPAVTMQAKLDNLNNTDYKLYEHLSTLGSYMKQDYRTNETGNRILLNIQETLKRTNTYV